MRTRASIACILFIIWTFKVRFDMNKHEAYYKPAFKIMYKHLQDHFPGQNLSASQLEKNCFRVDLNSLLHPDTIYEDKYLFNFYAEYADKQHFVDKYGFTYDRLKVQLERKNKTEMSNFQGLQYSVWSYEYWYQYQTCLFEKKMRIPMINAPFAKNTLNLIQNRLIEKTQNQQCKKALQIAKRGYSLSDELECREIIGKLMRGEYRDDQHPIKYLIKEDKHEGTGVNFLLEADAKRLIEEYDHQKKCGILKPKGIQIQEFIDNPLLLTMPDTKKGHAFVFRSYLLIVSTQPLIVYLYDKTSLQVALHPFTNQTFSKYTHFCNPNFIKKWIKEHRIPEDRGMEILKSRESFLSYQELTDRFVQQGKLADNAKASDFLIKKIEEKMALYFQDMSEFYHDSRFAQNSAVDFIMTEDLELYLLEFNIQYNMEERYDERAKFQRQLQTDNIEVMLKYLRAKYARVKRFIEDELAMKLNYVTHEQIEKALSDELNNNQKHLHGYTYLNLKRGHAKCDLK